MFGCETPEERSARENAELDAKMAKRRKREAKEAARRMAEAERLAIESKPPPPPTAELTDQPEELQRVYSRMTTGQRAAAMREACAAGCDDLRRKAILDSAPASERASLDRLADSLIAQHEARERAREAQERAQRNAGRVCCCDGTVSKTCTTVRSGCCSHHGGVCACE